MRIVAHLNAPVLKTITLDEFLPLDRHSLHLFLAPIVDRYNFQDHGQPEGGTSYVFQQGNFVFNGVETPILSLDIQAGRIQAACTTTAQSIAFFNDLIDFLVRDLQFRNPTRPVIEFMSSALVVDFEENIVERINGMAKIHALLTSHLGHLPNTELHAQGLRFAGQTKLGEGREALIFFGLEERLGRPAGTNWFFSQAPLPSDTHVDFLTELSNLF